MKKILLSTVVAGILASSLSAYGSFEAKGIVMEEYPIPSENRAVSNGGTKPDIDAYQDGVGVVIGEFGTEESIDNSGMNSLVYKYGEKAKDIMYH